MLPHGRAEAALLSNLRHPYVLAFYGCSLHDRHLYIVTGIHAGARNPRIRHALPALAAPCACRSLRSLLSSLLSSLLPALAALTSPMVRAPRVSEELCDMTLRDLIQRRERQRLSLEPALSLAMQVAEGLAYLHMSGVVHRDLSASNIFLCLDEAGGNVAAKIGDFGLSRRTAEQTSMTALIGTIQYMAPEMLTSASAGRVEYSAAVDVFSFGIILWQLVTCEQPYAATLATLNRFQLLQRIARDGLRPEVPAFASGGLRSLMVECWAEAEHSRPPSADLVRRLRLLYFNEFGAEFEFGTRGQGPALAQHFTAQHFAAAGAHSGGGGSGLGTEGLIVRPSRSRESV